MATRKERMRMVNNRANQAMDAQMQRAVQTASPRVCGKCGCPFFVDGYGVRVISSLASPTGQEVVVRVPALLCVNCLHPLDTNDPNTRMKEKETADDGTNEDARHSDATPSGEPDGLVETE